jgi:hypothetical protein
MLEFKILLILEEISMSVTKEKSDKGEDKEESK